MVGKLLLDEISYIATMMSCSANVLGRGPAISYVSR